MTPQEREIRRLCSAHQYPTIPPSGFCTLNTLRSMCLTLRIEPFGNSYSFHGSLKTSKRSSTLSLMYTTHPYSPLITDMPSFPTILCINDKRLYINSHSSSASSCVNDVSFHSEHCIPTHSSLRELTALLSSRTIVNNMLYILTLNYPDHDFRKIGSRLKAKALLFSPQQA